MKKNNLIRIIFTCLAVILFACMAMGSKFVGNDGTQDYISLDPFVTDEEYEEYCYLINSEIESCTGRCLAREGMAHLVYNFEKVQKRHNGEEMTDLKDGSRFVLVLTLETPGEHEHDENTRYMIMTQEKDEHGFYKGIRVMVMPEGMCEINDDTIQQGEDDDQATIEDPNPEEPSVLIIDLHDIHDNGCWKLNSKRTYIKEGDPTSYTQWKYTYSATENSHKYNAYLPPSDDRVASDTTFTATCSNPPEVIKPGDTVSFSLSLDMVHSGGMLVSASSYMLYGTPEEDGKGIRQNGYKFEPEEENGPYGCNRDTMGNSNISSANVKHTFEQAGAPGSELAIGFFGCDSLTIWIYEWQE